MLSHPVVLLSAERRGQCEHEHGLDQYQAAARLFPESCRTAASRNRALEDSRGQVYSLMIPLLPPPSSEPSRLPSPDFQDTSNWRCRDLVESDHPEPFG